jgi:predicted GIY-YIG superfamily endonuclease
MPFIYILHFDCKLSHAQHYVGCTRNPLQRLTAHANGAGSTLTKALVTEGIEWQLGSLLTCSQRRLRELERRLKDQANTARYCGICQQMPAKFHGTEQYPIEMLPWIPKSTALRRTAAFPTVQTVRFIDPMEPQSTMDAIMLLMREDKDALGFIPVGGEAGLQTLVPRGRIVLASEDNVVVGYCAWNMSQDMTQGAFHQVAVRDDQRFKGFGRKMLQLVIANTPCESYIAKVRDDLAANHFWLSMGFLQIDQNVHPTSGSRINVYRLIPQRKVEP